MKRLHKLTYKRIETEKFSTQTRSTEVGNITDQPTHPSVSEPGKHLVEKRFVRFEHRLLCFDQICTSTSLKEVFGILNFLKDVFKGVGSDSPCSASIIGPLIIVVIDRKKRWIDR